MSSSTSSFKSELKVILVVVAVVGLFEAGARVRDHYSPKGDESLLRGFARDARELKAEPGIRVILMGNSLTRGGYNLEVFQKELQAAGGGPISVRNCGMHGSMMVEWYYVFKQNFIGANAPDVLVVSLSPDGGEDGNPHAFRISWLSYEVGWRDVPELAATDLRSFDLSTQFMLARLSSAMAHQWNLRVDLVYTHIPHFWEGMQTLNGRVNLAAINRAKSVRGAPPPAPTYALLKRFMALIAANHTRLLVVAMPVREHYEIDPGLPRALEAGGMAFMDCRDIQGLTPDKFADGWHLTDEGTTVFSKYMARHLPGRLNEIVGRKRE